MLIQTNGGILRYLDSKDLIELKVTIIIRSIPSNKITSRNKWTSICTHMCLSHVKLFTQHDRFSRRTLNVQLQSIWLECRLYTTLSSNLAINLFIDLWISCTRSTSKNFASCHENLLAAVIFLGIHYITKTTFNCIPCHLPCRKMKTIDDNYWRKLLAGLSQFVALQHDCGPLSARRMQLYASIPKTEPIIGPVM